MYPFTTFIHCHLVKLLQGVIRRSASLNLRRRYVFCSSSASGKLAGLSTKTLVELLIDQHKQAVVWQGLFTRCFSFMNIMFKDASMDMLTPGILQTPGRLAAQQLQNMVACDAYSWNEMALEEMTMRMANIDASRSEFTNLVLAKCRDMMLLCAKNPVRNFA